MSSQTGSGEQLVDQWRRLPPLARNISTASFVLSVLCYTGFVGMWRVFWDTGYITKFPPEVWRFITSFLITNPQFGIILDPYFLYMYLSELERGNSRFPRREDLVWYLIFVSTTMVAVTELAWRYTPLLSGPYPAFISGLIMSLCYTVHQDQRGRMASFIFFTVPAQLVPYLMIVFSFIMGNLYIIPLQIIGLLIAHAWDFGRRLWPEFAGGRVLLPTPGWVSYLIDTPRVLRRDYGAVYTPSSGAQPSTGSSTGADRGPLPESWKSRGPGRRLG
ncbi:hypothetical protein SAPIO_CDS8876 [Scedosporium apiospermum]|uniref:Derlin n=1 Tax=Pseudallescheria apiosperma TaxID=563466 RepID=A0A084FXV2_PSEDA|nr:uncharacterized protein SAPIO_CDS8876 [Scedosporium apiospermum]KEZ39914.1 hypothetical protein SAPIO_CDS8876 [Scedosporium apiospermum]